MLAVSQHLWEKSTKIVRCFSHCCECIHPRHTTGILYHQHLNLIAKSYNKKLKSNIKSRRNYTNRVRRVSSKLRNSTVIAHSSATSASRDFVVFMFMTYSGSRAYHYHNVYVFVMARGELKKCWVHQFFYGVKQTDTAKHFFIL